MLHGLWSGWQGGLMEQLASSFGVTSLRRGIVFEHAVRSTSLYGVDCAWLGKRGTRPFAGFNAHRRTAASICVDNSYTFTMPDVQKMYLAPRHLAAQMTFSRISYRTTSARESLCAVLTSLAGSRRAATTELGSHPCKQCRL